MQITQKEEGPLNLMYPSFTAKQQTLLRYLSLNLLWPLSTMESTITHPFQCILQCQIVSYVHATMI